MHQFYDDDRLLFTLDKADEYDTATPYRYAVSRFVELAEKIKKGHIITVRSPVDHAQTVALQTVAQLMNWISVHFTGFDQHMQ